MRSSIIIILLCSLCSVYAQETLNWNALAPDNNLLLGNEVYLTDAKQKKVEGTPLLFENWTKGKLVLKNKVMDNLLLNILNDEGQLYVLKVEEDSIIYNVDESVLKDVIIYDEGFERTFRYYSSVFVENRYGKSKFYEVLYEGSSKLLKLGRKSFVKAEQDKAYNLKEQKDKYVLDESYYIRLNPDYKFQSVRLNKKALLKTLEGQLAARSKEILKNKKYKLSKEAQVVKFLKELDSGGSE